MERPRTIGVNTIQRVENGVTVSVVQRIQKRRRPGHTALHEAAHIEAAQETGGIVMATIVASSDYLGATWPLVMSATSAMAAAAHGMDGTGWDEFLTMHYLHVNPDSAKNSALTVLAGRREYMEEVAQDLEEKSTIGQSDVDKAHQRVDKRRRGVWDVAVIVDDPSGKRAYYSTQTEENKAMVPGEWIDINSKISPTGKRKDR